MSHPPLGAAYVRNTEPRDFDGIIALSRLVYPESPPWRVEQLESHLRLFPEGQFVAVERDSERVFGMASSLIVSWREYDFKTNWRAVTEGGMFTNHDPAGRTLYGAEVLVMPKRQRLGIGSKLYSARRKLTRKLGLLRILAAARLRGYHRHASQMSAEEYVLKVVRRELRDPTLSFQLRNGFEVLGVVSDYLRNDPESLGHAAVIEWLNPRVASPEDYARRTSRFLQPHGPHPESGPRH